MMHRALLVVLALGQGTALAQQAVVLEDFEGYAVGGLPTAWFVSSRGSNVLTPIPPNHARPGDFVRVIRDGSGQVLQVYTRAESVQILLPADGEKLKWDLRAHPRLSWQWKALRLPQEALETRSETNDTGGALYVAFDCADWLRRPCIIKYVYSTSLEIGTTAHYRRLRVLVVSSGAEGIGQWQTVERDVGEDYRSLFGEDPPGNPRFIMLWGDSDTTEGESEVYFDNLVLLPEN
ncbi:MAG: DUF3047 domain-containing protein [Bacteroidota bacterium]|nr:DUF3047 domain-containing protein [Bacteroidota bacterium]MDE2957193.1 DUF3047 domain-containing protein [Bacteroidota bacterium]